MKLSKENLGHVNTISHEGKVLLFGTDNEGIVWYTVKQSGFEDSVFSTDADTTNGFEVWKQLPLGESAYDASTVKKFGSWGQMCESDTLALSRLRINSPKWVAKGETDDPFRNARFDG